MPVVGGGGDGQGGVNRDRTVGGGDGQGGVRSRQPNDTLPTRWFPGPRDGVSSNATRSERRELTFAANRDYRSIIYGRNRVGSAMFAVSNSASTGRLICGFAIGEGPLSSIEDTHAFGGTGLPWLDLSAQYLGTSSPSSDSELQTALGSVETYPYLAWAKGVYNTDLLTGALELPSFTVTGLQIYDPRQNRLRYSETGRASGVDPGWTFSSAPTIAATANEFSYTGSQASTTTAVGAFRWTWGGSGPYSAYRSTSSLSASTTTPILVSCKMRVTSGTASVNLKAIRVTGSETTTTVCSLSTTWQRFEAIVTSGSSTSEGRIQIDGIPPSTVMEVDEVVVQTYSSFHGYIRTADSALAPLFGYSANPALEMADLKTNTRYGQRMGPAASFVGGGLNDLHTWWSASGDITPGTLDVEIDGTGSPNTFKWRYNGGGYTTGVAITGANQNLTQGIRIRFDALTGHTSGNSWSISIPSSRVDWASVGVAAAYCDEKLGASGTTRFACHLTLREPAPFDEWERTIGLHFGGRWVFSNGQYKMAVHRPTTTIAYSVTRSHIIGSPSVSRGTTAGTLDEPNRVTVRWVDPSDDYKEKPLTVSYLSRDQEEIREGQPYSLVGCQAEDQARRTATYLLNGMLADLNIDFEGTAALAELLPGDRIQVTDDTVGLSAQDFTVSAVSRKSGSLSVNISAIEYDAAIWSNEVGATDSVPSSNLINPFATPPEPQRPRQASTRYPPAIYWNPPTAFKADTQYGAGSWAHSGLSGWDASKVNDTDTGSTAFTNPTSGSGKYARCDLGSAKSISAVMISMTQSGATALSLYNVSANEISVSWSDDDASYTLVTPARGPQVDSSGIVTGLYIDWAAASHRYWRVNFPPTPSASQVVAEIQWKEVYGTEWPFVKGYEIIYGQSLGSPLSTYIPKGSIPTSDSPISVLTGAIATPVSTYIAHTSDVIIRTVGYGSKSTGRYARVQSLSDADDSAINTVPVLRSTTGLTKQVGGLAMDGLIECGGLSTTQVSRQTPWIEPRTNCSTLTSLTTATVVNITGATVTFTPPNTCRVMVVSQWLLEAITVPSGEFRGRLDINGAEEAEQVKWLPQTAGEIVTLHGVWDVDLTGGVSYTIKLRGNLSTATGRVDVGATHTGFVIMGVGKL